MAQVNRTLNTADDMADEPCVKCSALYGHVIFHDPKFGEFCNFEQDSIHFGKSVIAKSSAGGARDGD